MCQAVHAAHEAGIHLVDRSSGISNVVVCAVPDENRLLQARSKIEDHGIRSVVFYEPDIGNQATALATEPISGRDRKVLAKYKLWDAELHSRC